MYFISRGNQLGKGNAPSISSNRSREESTWLYLELLNILDSSLNLPNPKTIIFPIL